jgi:hypothetical protein
MKRRSTASRSAKRSFSTASDYRQNDGRHHSDAANPDDYGEDMNRSGNRDVIHGDRHL